MDIKKQEKLKAAGWAIGSAYDFVGLTPDEIELVELRLSLSRRVKQLRLAQSLTQSELAKRIGSSQSRIAKMEAGDPSVSLELLLRSAFALGDTRADVFKAICE